MDHRHLLLALGAIVLFIPAAHCEDYSEARRAVAVAVSSHQNAQALGLLEPLLKAHPEDPSLWTLRGIALDGPEQTQESLDSFDKALSIDKAYLPALKGASQVAYLHGDARAPDYVQRLLAVAPANEVANGMAAVLAYQAKDCPNAIRYFERSGQEVYKSLRGLAEFSDCLVKQDQWTQAGNALAHGLELHPESVQIKYNLALIYVHNHDADEAIRILEPLAGEKDAQLLNVLAAAYTQANRPDDAFRMLENAILISPEDESNYLDLSILCLEHNQENRSIVAASAGIAKLPKAASLYLIRGVAYAQVAEYEKAEKDFETAAIIDPNQPHSTIAKSLLYSDRNQVDKEKALLQQQLTITPNDAVANYLMAEILVREGAEPGQPQFSQAIEDLSRSLTAQPESVEAQVLMGTLCQKENNLSAALDHFERALKVEPDNRSALNHKLLLLQKLHRSSDAGEVARRLKLVIDGQIERETPLSQVRVNP